MAGIATGQEICDNGVDDNGDGLIDLNDPECECLGIPVPVDVSNIIPNMDFEDMSCCPQFVSEMDCVDGWEAGTGGTVDYIHECGYIPWEVSTQGLVPFPSGSGALGALFHNGFKEYPTACLNSPFLPGVVYTLTFQIGAAMIGPVCPITVVQLPPTTLTLYGNMVCEYPVFTTDCPSSLNPNWQVIGTVTYQPIGAWQEISIVIEPTFEVNGIMLGPACVLPPEYSPPCFPYFVYDDMSLESDQIELLQVEIFPVGLQCNLDFSLNAFINHQGGQWQWYFNGVAMVGEIDQFFSLENNQFQSGTYQVTYTTEDGCSEASILLTLPPPIITEIEVYTCLGEAVDCAGMTYNEEGEYSVVLKTADGCDSTVICRVINYDPIPHTLLEMDACAPFSTNVCGKIYSTTGYYNLTCKNENGCDSVVVLDLRVMNQPQVIIEPPNVLNCDPNSSVTLNALASPANELPSGTTTFEWTGTSGGFVGVQDEPIAIVNLPGEYCLIITFESNGVTCADTACVTVVSVLPLPDPPLISGAPAVCLGDTLIIQGSYKGSVITNGWDWTLPTELNYALLNDSNLIVIPTQSGNYNICARMLSECGSSDTTCLEVHVLPTDIVTIDSSTCDSAKAGVFTSYLANVEGCDSTVITTITLSPSQVFRLDLTTCDPQQAARDTLYFINQYGCDSVHITHVELLPTHQISLLRYDCDSTLAGLDTLSLLNQYGCDSVVFIETIFTGNYQESTSVFLCGSDQNYSDTLFIFSGQCDSLFITHYEFIPPDTTMIVNGTCDPAQVGQQIEVLTSTKGCDSIVLTMVNLNPSHNLLVEGFTCVASEERFEVLNLTNQYGCDSIVTIDIRFMGIDTQYYQATTCDPLQEATVSLVLPGMYCDTVRVTEFSLLPSSQSVQEVVLCQSDGPAFDTIWMNNYLGCDSLVIRAIEYVNLLMEVDILDQRCTGLNDGAIFMEHLDGGQQPLSYRLDQGIWQSDPKFENLAPGNYTVYVQESGGCTDTLTGLVVGEGFTLTVDAGPDHWVDLGDFIPLKLTSNLPVTQIQWSAVDFLVCSTCPATSLGPVRSEQTVSVSVFTADGCTASDALDVRIRPLPEVYIPNSFSPNADGINDIFSVYGNDLVVAIRNMAIYDRWGNALYFKTDLPVNDPAAGWDGSFRGKQMDPGVYVYVVVVELMDGSTHIYKGDVTVAK
jgi:gliding motility-associated-like protein